MPRKVAALFVEEHGPYSEVDGVELWHKEIDARRYNGPYPAVAHPPCERWGNFWHGASATTLPTRMLGDDGGCFLSGLLSVRVYGGVLEHPKGSRAWKWFGIRRPVFGKWTRADGFGFTCCVSQAAYGHRAEKLTLLYAVGCKLPKLKTEVGSSFLPVERMGRRERMFTPPLFRDELIRIARTVGHA